MEEDIKSESEKPQFSGEGTISGPGKSGQSKTPFIFAFVFLVLLTGTALVMQNKSSSPPPDSTPAITDETKPPLSMETFTKDQAENPVTADNASEVITTNQAELEYGLDQYSLTDSVFDVFSSALNN